MGATSTMNRSAKGGARLSLQYGGEGVLIHPPHQGVCGWHGTEEQRVTSGGLTGSLDGTGVSRPISESEAASDALSVDGRLCRDRKSTRLNSSHLGISYAVFCLDPKIKNPNASHLRTRHSGSCLQRNRRSAW